MTVGFAGPGPDLDVIVVGDGPAGAALASACRQSGCSVAVVGPGSPWTNTYGTWRDDVSDLPDDVFVRVLDRVVAVGERHHELGRPYGVLDGARLRSLLLADVEHRDGEITSVQHFAWGSRGVARDGSHHDARIVIDATGRGLGGVAGRQPSAWQTAYGVVLDEVPAASGLTPGAVTLMDWRPLPGAPDVGAPTFGYVVPVADGWLVEETVLAASPAVEPDALVPRLAARLGPRGASLMAGARTAERVRIPMGVRAPGRHDADLRFGAAAGYVHPATGYSVAASLRAAPRVAAAIVDELARGEPDIRRIQSAIWPDPHRRARALHDYGLAALDRLDAAATRAFFDAFFDLPVEVWREYLRVDTTPAAVASVMRRVFSAAPWPVRRQLMAGDPRPLVRSLRPGPRLRARGGG